VDRNIGGCGGALPQRLGNAADWLGLIVKRLVENGEEQSCGHWQLAVAGFAAVLVAAQ
jgi:hypothetical protein